MRLNKVNQFLKKNVVEAPVAQPLLSSGDTIKNIVVSEIININKLDKISEELIDYLSKDLKKQSRKDQQSLLRDIEVIKSNKRDFVFNVAKEMQKNEFLHRIFVASTQPSETVIAEDGTIFQSEITPDTKRELQAILIDLINDKTRV